MSDPNPPITDRDLVGLEWRVSSFSDTGADRTDDGANGAERDCIEVARLADGRTALRNRSHPELGTVVFTPAEMDAWIKGCKAGEFDDIR
jgi:hypothetical protein